jgi:hypothetical protein
MPRYVIERTFPDGLEIPMTAKGMEISLKVVGRNAEEGVTWVHSYVTQDKKKTFCVYDGPTPEASARSPSAMACRSTASAKCACSILISICDGSLHSLFRQGWPGEGKGRPGHRQYALNPAMAADALGFAFRPVRAPDSAQAASHHPSPSDERSSVAGHRPDAPRI